MGRLAKGTHKQAVVQWPDGSFSVLWTPSSGLRAGARLDNGAVALEAFSKEPVRCSGCMRLVDREVIWHGRG